MKVTLIRMFAVLLSGKEHLCRRKELTASFGQFLGLDPVHENALASVPSVPPTARRDEFLPSFFLLRFTTQPSQKKAVGSSPTTGQEENRKKRALTSEWIRIGDR